MQDETYENLNLTVAKSHGLAVILTGFDLMGEGFILLTRGYGFMGGCTTPLLTR